MTGVTLRVLDGADRGRVFDDLAPPVTIGREEGNSIQLNDERISRFHLKIQLDHDDVVLTDLESTNGTKVNNEEVQLRILRHGDMITLGRSTLLFGTRGQINERLEKLNNSEHGRKLDVLGGKGSNSDQDLCFNRHWKENPNYQLALLDLDPPGLPERLTPGQAAQLSELLEFFHMHFRKLIGDAKVSPRAHHIELSKQHWQQILDIQARLGEYLRKIGHPD
jgi:pSer/pThr/pTyr-binding forkhead associated (FHA) protein